MYFLNFLLTAKLRQLLCSFDWSAAEARAEPGDVIGQNTLAGQQATPLSFQSQ